MAGISDNGVSSNNINKNNSSSMSVWAGIASAAGGLLSSLFGGNYSAKKAYQAAMETNKYNRENMIIQNLMNRDNWNMENEYNMPSNQVQRLQAAGLNPYLMLNGGSSGVASSMPGVTTQPGVTPDTSQARGIVGSIGDSIQAYLNGSQLGLQMDAQRIQNKFDKSAVQPRLGKIWSDYKDSSNREGISGIEYSKAQEDWLAKQRINGKNIVDGKIDYSSVEGYYAWTNLLALDNLSKVIDNLDIDSKTKRKKYEWIDKREQANLDMIASNIDLNTSSISRNISEIDRNNHLNALTDAQKGLVLSKKKAQDLENIISRDPDVQDARRMQEYIKSVPTNIQQVIFADPWYQRYIKAIKEGKKPTYEETWNVKRLFKTYGLITDKYAGSALGSTVDGLFPGPSSIQNPDTHK